MDHIIWYVWWIFTLNMLQVLFQMNVPSNCLVQCEQTMSAANLDLFKGMLPRSILPETYQFTLKPLNFTSAHPI